jgi:radical SAM superfamily enzyme YgiQ (UPF0313 family)
MVGNPGETHESVKKTLALVKKIRADYINVNFITPFPGTELHRLALKNEWLLDDYDPMALKQDRCVMNATRMDTVELQKMSGWLQRRFYLRPFYLLKRILSVNLFEWKKNLTGARELIFPRVRCGIQREDR